MKTIDLHSHTTASDGSYTPTELIDYAVKKKLSAIAITDHDTMNGIPEAIKHIAESQLPLELIPGMEMSASGMGQVYGIHILAYFLDKNQEEQEQIINNAAAAFTNSSGSPKDAIEIVSQYGGITSLAHPLEYSSSILKLDKIIGKLAAMGLSGIEGIYTTHSDDQIKQFKAIAEKYDLIITGGSDFHGTRKLGVDLGNGFGDMIIPYEIVNSMKEKTIEHV